MSNYIISGDTYVSDSLTINGNTYIVMNENALNKIENINEYKELSGNFENLNIEGNLVLCNYTDFTLCVNGCTTTINTITLE